MRVVDGRTGRTEIDRWEEAFLASHEGWGQVDIQALKDGSGPLRGKAAHRLQSEDARAFKQGWEAREK